MPRTFVCSQKTNEQLDKRMVAEGRERGLGALCSQNALSVIPRTALSPGTKKRSRRFVDDMNICRVKNKFVAAEVARDVRHDVHAGTPALKALKMIVSLAATRDGKHRPRILAQANSSQTFVAHTQRPVVVFHFCFLVRRRSMPRRGWQSLDVPSGWV